VATLLSLFVCGIMRGCDKLATGKTEDANKTQNLHFCLSIAIMRSDFDGLGYSPFENKPFRHRVGRSENRNFLNEAPCFWRKIFQIPCSRVLNKIIFIASTEVSFHLRPGCRWMRSKHVWKRTGTRVCVTVFESCPSTRIRDQIISIKGYCVCHELQSGENFDAARCRGVVQVCCSWRQMPRKKLWDCGRDVRLGSCQSNLNRLKIQETNSSILS